MPVYRDTERNTWFAKLNYKDPVTGKYREKKRRGFKTKKAAQNWLVQMMQSDEVSSSATFMELFEENLKYLNSSETSANMKRSWVELHFPYKDVPLNKITKPMLMQWRAELAESGLATRTRNRGIGYIKSVFRYANAIYGLPDYGQIIRSYSLTKEDKKEMNTWSPEEFNRFIDAMDEGFYKAYFTFLYWTGCRRSEGLAVRKEDFNGNTVHIYHSIKHFSGGFLPLKTDSSERYITLDSKTYEYLKPYIQDGCPFIFGGKRSLPITNVQREFDKAIKKSGVKKIRIHDLRHSHASYLLGNNVPPVAVKDRLGHSSVNQTLSTYAHLMRKPHDAMIATIDELRKIEKV